MNREFQERRRSSRITSNGGVEFRVGRRVRVRLLEISANGALLATDETVPTGSIGRMHLPLNARAFEAAVEVKREEPTTNGRGRVLGVAMRTPHAEQRRLLEDFLGRAGA